MAKGREKAFCSEKALMDTINSIRPRLFECYSQTVNFPIVTSAGSTTYHQSGSLRNKLIERHNEDSSFDYIITQIVNGNQSYGMRLHIEKADEINCPTKITANTMNIIWDRHVGIIKKWLNNSEVSCGI